jgi:hypothetical protein
LDRECPNVLDHGVDRHQINLKTLIHQLDQQLSNNDLRSDLKLGCESLRVHGTRGALFKVTLWYTFVGKGTPVEFVTYLASYSNPRSTRTGSTWQSGPSTAILLRRHCGYCSYDILELCRSQSDNRLIEISWFCKLRILYRRFTD